MKIYYSNNSKQIQKESVFQGWLVIGVRASLPCWWLAAGCSLSLAMWIPPTCFIRANTQKEQEQDREGARKMEVTVFSNLVTEMTSHHFWCITFVRRKSWGPAHYRGEEITQSCEFQETGTIEFHVRSCPSQVLIHTRSISLMFEIMKPFS